MGGRPAEGDLANQMKERRHFKKNRENQCVKCPEKSGKINTLRTDYSTMRKSLLTLTSAVWKSLLTLTSAVFR